MIPTLFETPLAELPVVSLDVELTGLDPARDRICEIGLVQALGGEVIEEYASLVWPDAPMSPGARAVHGIPDEDLESAPKFREVADRLVHLCADTVLVGHNVEFDLFFINAALVRTGRPPLTNPWIDTLTMSRRLFALVSNRLPDVCVALDVPHDNHHRALDDARAALGAAMVMFAHLDDGAMTLSRLNALVNSLAPDSPVRRRQRELLTNSFRSRTSVWIDYLTRSGEGPWHVVRREVEIWKVRLPRIQAWCRLREGERVFRVERIRHAEPGAEGYEIPEFKARI